MRIEYISHSCFIIESGTNKIVFDPWITGTAYNNQWHLYPKPVDISKVQLADIILISHGHEDHFHDQSLRLLSKSAHVFFPFQWRAGVVGYLKHLNFEKITEAVSFKTYELENIKVTYLGYSLESVIVVECDNMVIVNINDALNSNHENAVQFLLNKIKSRWPKIDFLLSGWSGAGYFPNKVHYTGKDDVEVARLREQYFANNFCRFTKHLEPEIAIAFAPGFVLLTDENRWINEIKFPREILTKYYSENFDSDSGINFPLMYPGDFFEGKVLSKISKLHEAGNDHSHYSGLNEVFRDEIAAINSIGTFPKESIGPLIDKLSVLINERKSVYHKTVLNDIAFSLLLLDVSGEINYLNIFLEGEELIIKRSNTKSENDRLLIRTTARLLNESLDKDWGGDLLTIGYGIDVDVYEESSLEKNLDIVCVGLISRYPLFSQDVVRHSGRMLKYYLYNPTLTNLWITQKLKLRPYVNKYPFNERDHWITYNKCELCKVCNMPELDFEEI